jgi:Tfp pilus assembly pilus retraction ATPase PilT
MQHENSIIIQCELNADVRTMDEGVHGAALFEPDIMYVGDIKPGDDLPGITRAVENGALAILSSVMLNERALLDRFTPSLVSPDQASPFVRSAFRVQQGVGGKLSVFFIENVQGE